MIEFANILFMVVPTYMAASFAILLWRMGRKWALFPFVLSMLLIVMSTGLRSGYAMLVRMTAPDGLDYEPLLDDYRGGVYLIFALLFFAGAIIFDNELREVKVYQQQAVIWSAVFIAAVLLYIVSG